MTTAYPQLLISPTGMTETSTVVLSTAADDIWFGSSGSILPSVEAKILSIEGVEITGYDQPGELVIKSPSTVLGYLNNEAATKETFQDGWVRTGDEAVVRVGPKGTEHVFIVDRIKELIKVKVGVSNICFLCGVNGLTCKFRVSKLLPQSSKRISSPTPRSPTQL